MLCLAMASVGRCGRPAADPVEPLRGRWSRAAARPSRVAVTERRPKWGELDEHTQVCQVGHLARHRCSRLTPVATGIGRALRLVPAARTFKNVEPGRRSGVGQFARDGDDVDERAVAPYRELHPPADDGLDHALPDADTGQRGGTDRRIHSAAIPCRPWNY